MEVCRTVVVFGWITVVYVSANQSRGVIFDGSRTGRFAVEGRIRSRAFAARIGMSLLEQWRIELVVRFIAMMRRRSSTGQQGRCGECVGCLHVSKGATDRVVVGGTLILVQLNIRYY